jgi:COP9 signalosome complex subunit 3
MRAPRWVLKKLTATYVTLHLSDIGRAINIDSEDGVRDLLLSMVRYAQSQALNWN